MDTNARTILVGAGCGVAGLLLGGALFGAKPASPTVPPAVSKSEPAPPSAAPPVDVAATAPVPAVAAPPASDWRVEESTDALTDETIKMACVTSRNQVYLSSPYGPRGARLCIRQHPKFGRDVFLALDGSGQILCRSYDGCTIPIRFDEGAVQSFTGNEPSDNSSETIFVANDGRFIASARTASRIRVQIEFYQNGVQTFDFPAEGLVW